MSAAKHTPGPWTTWQGDDEDASRWLVVVAGGRPYEIAVIENGAPGDTLATERANAHLIAAAPDLLEACREACEYICRHHCMRHEELSTSHVPECASLRAAIAKAEGRS